MNINKILNQIAANEGINVEDVKIEMQKAIDEGEKNPDPAVKACWANIPKHGEKHTLEEIIEFLARSITHD